MKYRLFLALLTSLLVTVVSIGCSDDPPPVTTIPLPVIVQFTASLGSIGSGDSSLISYEVSDADSVRLQPLGITLLPTNAGAYFVKPPFSTKYTLEAYNSGGTATKTLSVSLTTIGIRAINGQYYRGVMGSDALDPLLSFGTAGDTSLGLSDPWIHFAVADGDGALSIDSARIDSGRVVDLRYNFSGVDGTALVRAMVRNVDTIEVELRANSIDTGTHAQGQYVRLSDTYGDVKNFNGKPERVDYYSFGDLHYAYAVYEDTKGVVVAVNDSAYPPGLIQNHEPVEVILLTSGFTGGQTADGISIGSSLAAVRDAYGIPDSEGVDTQNEPPSYLLRYHSFGFDFYTQLTGDSSVIELHVREPSKSSSPNLLPMAGKKLRDGATRILYHSTESSP